MFMGRRILWDFRTYVDDYLVRIIEYICLKHIKDTNISVFFINFDLSPSVFQVRWCSISLYYSFYSAIQYLIHPMNQLQAVMLHWNFETWSLKLPDVQLSTIWDTVVIVASVVKEHQSMQSIDAVKFMINVMQIHRLIYNSGISVRLIWLLILGLMRKAWSHAQVAKILVDTRLVCVTK